MRSQLARAVRKGEIAVVGGAVNHNRPGTPFCRGVGEQTWRLHDLVDDLHKWAADVLARFGACFAETGTVLFC